MKKVLAASLVGLGLLGLAACSDTDETTTQGVAPSPQEDQTTAPSATPTEPDTGTGTDTGTMGTE
jgi:ABC-type oligopeptide transport system substrate-binding subunit